MRKKKITGPSVTAIYITEKLTEANAPVQFGSNIQGKRRFNWCHSLLCSLHNNVEILSIILQSHHSRFFGDKQKANIVDTLVL